METPVPSPSLRVAPPPMFHQAFSTVALLLIPSVILLALWMAGRTTALAWIAPLLWVGFVVIAIVLFARRIQEPVYGLDANGISVLDRHNHATHLIAWSEIEEVRSGKQDELFLYTGGRERVVKITPNRQNYRESAPVLAEHLAPLWRGMTKQVYDKTFGASIIFLITLVFVVIGVTTLTRSLSPSFIFVGIGLLLAYQQAKSVRRIQFTSDGIVLTKVYGREIVSAAAIHTIELRRDGRGYTHSVLLKLNDNRTLMLDGFALDPISVYCIVAVWQRDQLNNATV